MASEGLKVIIAGAGIGGLVLALMLEKASIDYIVLERASEFKPLGSSISLTAQVLRVFDQLGILEEVQAVSLPMSSLTYFKQDLTLMASWDATIATDRYGYTSLMFPRPDLMQVLLRQVPPHKIAWGKRVLSTMQNTNGVMVRCASGETFDGDILVGADGAYSAVRQSMYKNLEMKGIHVPPTDTAPLHFDQYCILGVTSDISEEYPVLKENDTQLNVVIADKKPYNVYCIPLKGGRVGWAICGKLLQEQFHDQENFRFSDYGAEAIEEIRDKIDDIPVPIGGSIGQLMDKTEDISRIMLEDRYAGRTVLIGDACHKLIPAGGQGAIQTILDCVCLANLLKELPSTEPADITAVFKRYYDIRAPHAKKAVAASSQLSNLMSSKGLLADMMRGFILKSPRWIINKSFDSIYGGRPILNYLEQIDLKGTVKDSSKPATLIDKPSKPSMSAAAL
ncbi:hypothetical protein DFQ27_009444 [Actinomortierella ambigua]|uniref:FAD-binding domain-containing protein n=1 Tax=Actinomortierella ambigua TaxID=1343610 RepID=A0A9P6QJ65_9FUNG|nr:hypothetical protein DFQ27_009444 [Actinomortierella ambigua]